MRYLFLLLVLSGCNGGLPELVKEMAADPATACVTVTTVYGVARIYRTNSANTSVSCTPDGMTVTGGLVETPTVSAVHVPVRLPAIELQIVPVE